MTNGNQFLKSKGLIAKDKTEFLISFGDGREVNLGDLLMEFSKVNYERGGEYKERLYSGRDYLMQIHPAQITVGDTLVSLGYNSDGTRNL